MANTMQFAIIFSWETVVVVLCLLVLLGGLVRITTRRQTEILKEYLQPEHLRVEQLIMRPGTPPHSTENEPLADSHGKGHSPQTQNSDDNSP